MKLFSLKGKDVMTHANIHVEPSKDRKQEADICVKLL